MIKPTFDRILVRRIESDSRTAGGIIIPDTAREKPAEGVVIETGEGLRNDEGQFVPVIFKKGQRILFTKWSGTEVKHNGEELIIMKESDVLAIVE